MVSTVTGQISGTPSVSVTAAQVAGTAPNLGVKAPCVVATTTNITLTGLQTVDGVALAEGDRVLVKDQTLAYNNGIYTASAQPWERAVDFDGNRDATTGTLVYVISGTAGARFYKVTTAAGFVIGTDNISFSSAFPLITVSTSAPSGGTNGDLWARIT